MDNYQNTSYEDRYVNAVEGEFQRLMDEILRQYMPRTNSRQNRRYNQARQATSRESINNIDYLDIINYLRDVIQVYNNNIQDYQRNINLSLQTIQMIVQNISQTTTPSPNLNNIPSSRNVREETPRTRLRNGRNNDHLFSYILYRPTIRSQDAAALRNFFQNIVVRPTQQQIETATRQITYNSNLTNMNTSCPITLEEFQDGDELRQIRHCNHAFFEQPIQNWFQSNVRCPICRYDIRDFVLPTGEHGETTEPSPEENEIQDSNNAENTDTSENNRTTIPDLSFNINNIPGFQELIQELSDNFAVDLHSILNETLPTIGGEPMVDSSQNFVFEFQVEGNLHNL